MEVAGDETWRLDDIFPLFAYTLESHKRFHRKSFDNFYDDFFRKIYAVWPSITNLLRGAPLGNLSSVVEESRRRNLEEQN
ncbi:hypothetical protein K1719_001622 [Acacia pycnantha]|nr:hypothetical protein K1719_001622 [Acacia pycnantha]